MARPRTTPVVSNGSSLNLGTVLDHYRDKGELPPIVRLILRRGGGPDHERMKVAGWLWLVGMGYEIVDFEIGGFDVLGIKGTSWPSLESPGYLSQRIVIDAKASMNDLVAHFRKDSMKSCDIQEKFSSYANLHYVIAERGLIPEDSVHSPWGLLEYANGAVSVAKEAEPRAYLGSELDNVDEIALRSTKLFGSLLAQPAKVHESISRETRAAFLSDAKKAKEHILGLHNEICRLSAAFEYVHGYYPLRERILMK